MENIADTLIKIFELLGLVLMTLYVAYIGITKALEGTKEFSLFQRLMKVDRHGVVSKFFDRLADLPPDMVLDTLSDALLPVPNEDLYLERLVRDKTQVLPEPRMIGLHDTPNGKVKTQYYVDVLSACCDAETRRRLNETKKRLRF